MKVILLSGKAEAGKDTVASLIKQELRDAGYKVLVTHYADLLKYICRVYFGWDGKKDEFGRQIMQRVGTDTIRGENPDFWVNFVKNVLKFFPEEWDFCLIPDARFPNEVEKIKSDFDTHFIRVIRPNHKNKLTETQLKHPSETSLDGYPADTEIVNDGTLRQLRAKVHRLLEDTSFFRQTAITDTQTN